MLVGQLQHLASDTCFAHLNRIRGYSTQAWKLLARF